MDIYVGGLPFKMTEKELRSMFENYGEVESAKIIIDKITRQNKGFGFVTMPNNTEASLAIKSLNNFKIGERTISVTKSEPKAESGKKRSFGKDSKVEIMLEKAVQIQNSDLDLSPSLNPNQILELIELQKRQK